MQNCHVHRVVMQSELRSRACSRENGFGADVTLQLVDGEHCEHANISGARNEKQMIEAYLKRKLTQLSSVSEFRSFHFAPFATLARTCINYLRKCLVGAR